MAAQTADADTRALLEAMAADLAGAPTDPSVAERRALLALMARAYGPAPAPVAAVEDRTIEGPGGALRLRLYAPAGEAHRRPGVLHIHGGGWVLGDPDAYALVCRAYCAASGAVVVDVDYRRAPEHRYPAALDDCEAALRWLAASAGGLGVDPARIVIAGDSAGGALAAALARREPRLAAGLVLVYPVLCASPDAVFASREALGGGEFFLRKFDIIRAEGEYLTRSDQGFEPDASPLLAPLADLAALPPTLIVTAGLDPLKDEAGAYAARLRQAGVGVREVCADATIHGFVLFAGRLAKGREAIALIGETIAGVRARA
jgi:acetyl esterase